MSLIHCPECGTRVSDRAPACVQCGAPLADPPTQTIEASSKVWKGIQLVGMVAMFLGFCSCAASFGTDHATEIARHEYARNGVNFFMVGLLGYVFGKGGRWWFHA